MTERIPNIRYADEVANRNTVICLPDENGEFSVRSPHFVVTEASVRGSDKKGIIVDLVHAVPLDLSGDEPTVTGSFSCSIDPDTVVEVVGKFNLD